VRARGVRAAAEPAATADVLNRAAGTEWTLFLISPSSPSRLSCLSCLSCPSCPSAAAVSSRRSGIRLHAQVPACGLNAGAGAPGQRLTRNLAHLTAGRIRDAQLHVANLFLVHPRHHRRLRRVLAVERLVAPELVVAIARGPPEHRGRRRREE